MPYGRSGRQNALGTAGLGLFGRLEGRRFVWNSIERSSHDVSRRKYDCCGVIVWSFMQCLARCSGVQPTPDFSHEKNARGTYLHT